MEHGLEFLVNAIGTFLFLLALSSLIFLFDEVAELNDAALLHMENAHEYLLVEGEE